MHKAKETQKMTDQEQKFNIIITGDNTTEEKKRC